MHRFAMVVGMMVVSLLAVDRSDIAARPADRITLHVSAAQAGAPVEFAVKYFVAGLEAGDSKEHLTAPFDITIPSADAYALFRQTGGTGVMRVEARKESGTSGSMVGPIAMVVFTGGRMAITGFQH